MDMNDGSAPGEGADQRPYVRFSAKVAREICWRTAAGETQAAICADPHMPCMLTSYRWSKRWAGFARAYARCRALGAGAVRTRSAFCPAAANEIVARVSEGEMLATICADAHLPSLRTIWRWRGQHPEFDEDLRLAREALAERLGDLGWKMALAATPQTAHLTRVQLGQLRWMAAVLGPRLYGKLKPTAPPAEPEVQTICYRHFQIEEHPETGQHRVVGWTPDPDTLQPVRTSEGEWKAPMWMVRTPQGHWEHTRERPGPGVEVWGARRAATPLAAPGGAGAEKPDDPEGWC
jgi:hypothetical protein